MGWHSLAGRSTLFPSIRAGTRTPILLVRSQAHVQSCYTDKAPRPGVEPGTTTFGGWCSSSELSR